MLPFPKTSSIIINLDLWFCFILSSSNLYFIFACFIDSSKVVILLLSVVSSGFLSTIFINSFFDDCDKLRAISSGIFELDGTYVSFESSILSLRDATEEEIQTGVVGGMAAMGGGCCGGGGHSHSHGGGSCGTEDKGHGHSHGGCGCH